MHQSRALSWNGSTCLRSRYSIETVEAVLTTLRWRGIDYKDSYVLYERSWPLKGLFKESRYSCFAALLWFVFCVALVLSKTAIHFLLSGAAYKREQSTLFLAVDTQNGRVHHVRLIRDVTRTTSIGSDVWHVACNTVAVPPVSCQCYLPFVMARSHA